MAETTDSVGTGSPASSVPGTLDPQIYCPDDGKTWKSKFHGRGGIIEQLKKDHAERAGAMETTTSQRDAQLLQTEARLAVLQKSLDDAKGQVEQLPELQQQAAQAVTLQEQLEALTTEAEGTETLRKQAGLAERYRMAMDFPGLLGLRVEQKEVDEEGVEQVVGYTNPILAMIEGSTGMPNEELRKALGDLASAMPSGEGVTPPPLSTSTVQPPNPRPSTEDDVASWRKRMEDAHQKINETGDATYWREYDEAATRYHALLAEQ